ncbi:MAG: hypothetical protein K9H16_02715 [Bacteroidales bacterium]|nr:hypothetical protein [Bacteroidales bacterium]
MALLKLILGKQNEKYRYKITVFMICLAISTSIWMLIKLSDQYSTDVTIPIVYSEIPEGKILVNKVDTVLKIGITDRGFALAWLKYFGKKVPVSIDLKNYRLRQNMHQYVALVGTQSWSQNFLEEYNLSGKVDFIHPDTIAFHFEERYTRQVPVKPNVTFNFRKQFFAYDSLTITPPQITISGLYQSISKISEVETVPVTFNNLNTPVNETIAIKPPFDDPDLRLEPAQVKLELPVEKFTESQIIIPISYINQPHNVRVKIFPEKVNITYLVALKDFKKMNPDMFVCSVDLAGINESGINKLEVSLRTFPPFIKIVSIDPTEVDFLVLK